MIPCIEKCVYQNEGICELEQAASSGDSSGMCRNRISPAKNKATVSSESDGRAY